MKTRRQFIIEGFQGTGALLVATDYARRITEHVLNTGGPLVEQPPNPDLKLYADLCSGEYTFTLHHPRDYEPQPMTWREWFEYECVDPDKPKEIRDWMIDQGHYWPDDGEPFVPPTPEESIPSELHYQYLEGGYAMHDSPEAAALRFLSGLDLGPSNPDEEEDPLGSLSFLEGPFPGSNYTAVTTYDPESISCLQLRLRQLKIPTEVVLTNLFG